MPVLSTTLSFGRLISGGPFRRHMLSHTTFAARRAAETIIQAHGMTAAAGLTIATDIRTAVVIKVNKVVVFRKYLPMYRIWAVVRVAALLFA